MAETNHEIIEDSEEKNNNQITGNIGMYYVCYQLSKDGWNAMPTSRNAKGIDILAYSDDGKCIGIQVKTISNPVNICFGKKVEYMFDYLFVVVLSASSNENEQDGCRYPKVYVLSKNETKLLMRHYGNNWWLRIDLLKKGSYYNDSWGRINKKHRDKKIWDEILNIYKNMNENNQLEELRQRNLKKAYWCRSEEKGSQELFSEPKQRLLARFVKSYLNTAWHKIQSKEKTEQENWFSQSNIIEKIQSIPDGKDNLTRFSKIVLTLLDSVELKNYGFNELQKDNFKALSYAVDNEYKRAMKDADLPKSQRVSECETIIFEQAEEPYRTILKMQKVLPGYGVALACDFLKESHLCNIAKPDVHLRHVFSVIDNIKYSMDLALVKRIAEFAENVGLSPNPDDFCNTGSYYIDKIIWMLCSRSETEDDDNKPSMKKTLLERIAAI